MLLPAISPPLIPLDFYCDSSSHRNHDFMVAGGIAIRQNRYEDITATINGIKADAGISSEMKWAKFTGGHRTAAYEALVDLLFLLVEQKQAAFHCIISQFGEFDHKAHDGTPDTSVNRMYFQLGLHRLCQFYGKKCAIHIYPDRGNDSRDLPNFRGVLCAHGYRRYNTRPNCIKKIVPRESADEAILQMVDIVIGAIAAKRNNRQLSGPKAGLAEYVLQRSLRRSWATDTPARARFLTVWNFRHQK